MNETIARLTRRDIEAMFSRTIYKRGLNYYQQGRVVDLEEKTGNRWYAKVEGSDVYNVVIIESNGFITMGCNCPAFDKYEECKHSVAVLLEVADRTQENSAMLEVSRKKREFEATRRLIESFAHYQLSDAKKVTGRARTPLNVEFICKSHSAYEGRYMTIEMKVGSQRLYVVRKLKELLHKIETGSTYFFTDNFTYDPEKHTFSEQDMNGIRILQEIANIESAYRDRLNSFWHKTNERELFIPPYAANRLMETLKDCDVRLEHNGYSYEAVELLDEESPFLFQLDQSSSGDFELKLENFHIESLFPMYGWLFYEGNLYKLTANQQAMLKELASSCKQNRKLPIAKEQVGSFLSNVAPGLKKIGQLHIAKAISNQIVTAPLKANVYVESEEDRLEVKLEYHYGEYVIHPFHGETQERGEIIMRDAIKEQEIMGLIESSSLKFNGERLYTDEEDGVYEFLFEVLPELEKKADIYLSGAVRSYMLPEQSTPQFSIDLDTGGNWLVFNFNMDGISEDDIQHVLRSVVEKKKYYRLQNGAFVSLENDQFQTMAKMIKDFQIKKDDVTKGSFQLPVYRSLQLEELMDTAGAKKKFGKAFRRLIKQLKHPDELDYELPSSLNASLRDYQETGFQWLKSLAHYRLGGILADDMGLGKTIQSISYILSEKVENPHAKPVLIVAPASLIYNWKNEFEKFAPGLQTEVVAGTPKERKEVLNRLDAPDVWITSYPTLRQDIDLYETREFDSVILDEAQAIKNHTTKTFKAVQKIKAPKRFALSGTPIENSLDELWSIFQAIMPGFFPNKESFSKMSHEQISKMVRPFILRRVKKDVLTELPDKIETNHLSELTKKQKELYLGYLEKIRSETEASIQTDGFDKSRMKILAGLTRLRQICCHPSLFVENYKGESGKLEQLLETADNAIENGKRLLIFSQFASMLQIIREALEAAGYDVFYLDGQTPAKERVDMAERFNAGEKDVFLISLKAGGTGLNLTGADTVILYDLWWNPAVEEQAAGRAHRIGQKNVVQVIRLIARGTIEEKIYKMQQRKKELIEKVIQPGETMITSLTEKEIREILNI
ncbi:DEAD/DEAH box helicase [Fictibacillus sp. Mic-4]|uniref:DEAD/DEAH box helicase n=1 Tax=Fictibacillus sp. Mic-4 TaxID=3132826 RepID=UPI003CE696D6